MARLARLAAPGLPHHITQRGNRRQTVFFSDANYEAFAAEPQEESGRRLKPAKPGNKPGRQMN